MTRMLKEGPPPMVIDQPAIVWMVADQSAACKYCRRPSSQTSGSVELVDDLATFILALLDSQKCHMLTSRR